MTTQIHPTAIVHKDAQLGDGVKVGPYSLIDARVTVGEGTEIGPYVNVTGHTTLETEPHLLGRRGGERTPGRQVLRGGDDP